MTALRVETTARKLRFRDYATPCAIGRSGACPAEDKREGDGYTPLGEWPLRTVLFRPGRADPPSGLCLPWRWIGDRDGWSDDPKDPAYNRPVCLPHQFRAENLNRDDCLYDVIVTLGHNDFPAVPGLGSAIFLHVWNDEQPTAGCVAISAEAMNRLLPLLGSSQILKIT